MKINEYQYLGYWLLRRNINIIFQFKKFGMPSKYLIALDRTHIIYVVFQSRKFWVISGFRRHLGLTNTLGLDPMPDKMKAALLWISQVRGYSHVSTRWSARKSLKSK